MRPLTALFIAFIAAGCGHNVGDHCATNVDCSPLGDRFCDTSAPSSEPAGGDQGGYCTVEGCDVRLNSDNPGKLTDSCPSEAVCVRFFTQVQEKPCTPATQLTDCSPGERCLCDCSDPADSTRCVACPNATSSTALGHCAPETSERRWCMLKCKKNSDCRGSNYECRSLGTLGAEGVPGEPPDGDAPPKFCVGKP